VAIQSQVPILPVVFSSYRTFLNDKLKILNSGEVIIEALEEIPTKGLTHDDINDLMQRTRQLMIDKFKENTKEILLKSPQNILSSFEDSKEPETTWHEQVNSISSSSSVR
jgi:c-di-GMP-related signal transduction protein